MVAYEPSIEQDPSVSSTPHQRRNECPPPPPPPLPCFLMGPYRLLLEPLLCKTDDFTQLMRKITVTVIFVLTVFPSGLCVYWSWRYSVEHTLGALCSAFVAGGLYVPTLVGSYVCGRVQRYVSDANIGLLLFVCIVGQAGVMVTAPHFASTGVVMTISILAAVARPARQWVLHLLAVLIVSFHTTNQVLWFDDRRGTSSFSSSNATLLNGTDPTPRNITTTEAAPFMLTINDYYRSPQLEYGVHCIIGLTCVFMSIVTVVAQSFTHVKQMKEAVSAVELTKAVVRHLQKYNTEAVVELLKQAKKKSEVDAKLITAFFGIADNLNKYRPHLPNFMFLDDDEEEDEDESVSISYSRSSPNCKSSVSEHSLDPGNDTAASTPTYASGTDQENYLTPAADHGPLGPSRDLHQGVVSWTVLDFRDVTRKATAEGLATAAAGSGKLHALVDIIYSTAAATKGSVHSLIGDTLHATWNATHRVAQPEVKASLFAARAVKQAKLQGLPPISAAVCSGKAVCTSTTSSTGQQALMIHLPWQQCLDGCAKLAQQFHSVVIDTRTEAAAQFSITAVAVDVIRCEEALASDEDAAMDVRVIPRVGAPQYSFFADAPTHFGGKSSSAHRDQKQVVFEIQAEIEHEEDEWMYQLDRQEKQHGGLAAVALTLSIQKVLSGDDSGARTALQEMTCRLSAASSTESSTTEEHVEMTPLMSRWCSALLT